MMRRTSTVFHQDSIALGLSGLGETTIFDSQNMAFHDPIDVPAIMRTRSRQSFAARNS
jgi:hypothetical protein